MNRAELIAQPNVPLIWPIVQPRLTSAMEKLQFVEFNEDYVLQLLMQEKAQLWIAGPKAEMMAITRIVSTANALRLVIDLIEGYDYEHYKECMEQIELWAVKLGATQAETEVRPGLEKVARQEGWKRQRIKMFKHLKQGIH